MRPICSFIQNPPAIPLYFFFVGKMLPQDNQKWVVKHVTWSCRNIGYALWRCYFDRALKFLQTGGQLTRLCTLTETPLVSVWKVLRWLLDLQQQVRFLIPQSEISPAFASWTSAIWTAAHHLGGLYQAFLLLVDYFWCFLSGNFKSNDPSKRTFIRVQKRLAWLGVVVEDELWMQWSQTLAGLRRTGMVLFQDKG